MSPATGFYWQATSGRKRRHRKAIPELDAANDKLREKVGTHDALLPSAAFGLGNVRYGLGKDHSDGIFSICS